MIITCKECNTNFNLDESLLDEDGSKVKCSICKDIFSVYPPGSASMPNTSSDISTGDEISLDVNGSQENLQSHNADLPNNMDVNMAAFDTELEPDLQHEDLPVNTESLISDNAIASKIFVEEKEPEKISLDIDLDMGEAMLEENSKVSENIDKEIDLALDMDIENPLQDEPDELSMELELESDDTAEEETEPAELSLDLDFALDMDEEKSDEPDEVPEDIDLALDMDIENPLEDEPEELSMELELESDDTTEKKADKISDEIEFELELVSDEKLNGEDKIEDKIAVPDEIDLSAIEKILDVEDGIELDEDKDNQIEDLTLELDMYVEEETFHDTGENNEEIESLDLADLENMLGVEENSEETDNEFVIDLTDSTEKNLGEVEQNEQDIDATQSLDLTEIETMLNMDDSPNQNVDSEDLTAEIELELDSDIDEDEKTDEFFEKTAEVDMSDIETMLDITAPDIEEDQQSDYHKTSDTIELEFDLDESDKADLYKNYDSDVEDNADKDKTKTTDEDSQTTSDQDVAIEADADINVTKEPIKKIGKKKVNKLVLCLLIVVLMGGGSYGAYTLIDSKSIKIPYINEAIKKLAELPYINDFFKDKKEDITGAIKITPVENTITGKYFNNTKAGELFVIKGKIRNDYDHPRSFIKVKANLFSKGGTNSKTRIVYCGNILSDPDIENLDLNAITKRLMNRNGDNKSNVNLKQGAALPFMVIFSNLPDNMNMFNVEPESSTP